MSLDRQVTDDQPHTQVAVDERSVEVRTEHADGQTLFAIDGDGLDVLAAVPQVELTLAQEVMLAREIEAAVERVTGRDGHPASGGGSGGG